MAEHNIKLTVAYDGAAYAGWQRQAEDKGISVQQRVEEALKELLGHAVSLNGAGRTDAGVHAFGQVANFICDKPVPVFKMPEILNRLLPEDIRVMEAAMMPADFHARFTPHVKRYRYLIEQEPRISPFAAHYSWQVGETLNINAMVSGAQALIGEHDFRHYTLTKASVSNYVRRIMAIDIYEPLAAEAEFPWQQLNSPLVIDVIGNGFLYKMVRLIVGRLVAVGRGQLPYRAMLDFLNGETPLRVPPAPAQGLFLDSISYESSEDFYPGEDEDMFAGSGVIF